MPDVYGAVGFHRMLLDDEVRCDSYRRALRAIIRPGDLVLDLGTGSGIMAFFACQAGARHVYAVDSSDFIHFARQLARENGLEEQITFIQEDIRKLQLDRQVDVIVSELITKIAIGERMEELTARCRRFLKPGGRIVPQNVELWLAPVEVPDLYKNLDFPDISVYGIGFDALAELSRNQIQSVRFQPEQLLAEPRCVYHYNSLSGDPSTHLDERLVFRLSREGTMHGYAAWFVAELADGVSLSNRPPGLPSWDNSFLVLASPVPATEGGSVELRLIATHPPGLSPVWLWHTKVFDAKDEEVFEAKQSTFFASALSPRTLQRLSADNTPELGEIGEMAKLTLSLCDGRTKVSEVAEQLLQRFPESLSTALEAEHFVQNFLLGNELT